MNLCKRQCVHGMYTLILMYVVRRGHFQVWPSTGSGSTTGALAAGFGAVAGFVTTSSTGALACAGFGAVEAGFGTGDLESIQEARSEKITRDLEIVIWSHELNHESCTLALLTSTLSYTSAERIYARKGSLIEL